VGAINFEKDLVNEKFITRLASNPPFSVCFQNRVSDGKVFLYTYMLLLKFHEHTHDHCCSNCYSVLSLVSFL
jgi:hypothetical protein